MKTKTKFSHRVIAVFFTLNFLQTLIPYNQLWANSNGPKSPEASAFEPVDATDMVNLLTGDMSYVLPILNVPSPEGGYPLALSYHAGIAVDQEASWVGLGWNLNPGALNRNINKTPDDWYDVRTYDLTASGEIINHRGGINVGFNKTGGSIGLYVSYTENKTLNGEERYRTDFGATVSVGLGGENSPFSISGSLGTDGVSVGLGIQGGLSDQTGIGGRVSVFKSFQNGKTGFSISGGVGGSTLNNIGGGSLGISLSSNGIGVSAAGASQSLTRSINGANNINVVSKAIGVNFYFVDLSYSYTKSWFFEADYTINQGSLYGGDMDEVLESSIFDSKVDYDGYESYNPFKLDSELSRGNMALIGYDNYSIAAQGISGALTPRLLDDGYIYNKLNKVSTARSEGVNYSTHYPEQSNLGFKKNLDGANENRIHFYFKDEYSSYLNYDSGRWNTNVINPVTVFDYQNIGSIQENNLNGVSTYNSNTGRIKRGNYIETYTNQEIIDNDRLIFEDDFIDRNTDLFPKKGIGAYKITTVDGKTYHFTIPVYQREQVIKRGRIDKNIEDNFSENQQFTPYATHWLLTGVTGPDYIDVDKDNKLSEADYGYWVKFEYGKWSDGYGWRTPYEGEREFEQVKTYSWGVKDIYYLDKVKTRTHTALFVKKERRDGFGADISIPNRSNDLKWYEDNQYGRSFILGDDGYWYFPGVYGIPQRSIQTTVSQGYRYKSQHGYNFNVYKQKALQLDKIILVKNNSGYSDISTSDGAPNINLVGHIKASQKFTTFDIWGRDLGTVGKDVYEREWYGEYYDNVLEESDIQPIYSDLMSKAQRVIDFNYDESYPLAKNTPNSEAASRGRLTLKKVYSYGKRGASMIPPYKFEYHDEHISFDEDKIDEWGYYDENPDVWSLKTIETPTGGKIKINYEEDEYNGEVITSSRVMSNDLKFSFREASSYGKYIEFKNADNVAIEDKINFTKFFTVGEQAKVDAMYWRHPPGDKGHRIGDVSGEYNVISVSQDNILIDIPDNNLNPDVRRGATCFNEHWSFYNLFHKITNQWFTKLDESGCGDPRSTSNGTRMRYSLFSNKEIVTGTTKGGGIRVKDVILEEDINTRFTTSYSYNNPDRTHETSGITSYAPAKYAKSIDYAALLPTPSVMYEHVRVENKDVEGALIDFSEYKFNTLKDINYTDQGFELGEFMKLERQQNVDINNRDISFLDRDKMDLNFTKHNLIDNTTLIGSLASVKNYNSKGQLIEHTENIYKGAAEEQGTIKESFRMAKYRYQSVGNPKTFLNISSREKKESTMQRTITRRGNMTFIKDYEEEDLFTGENIKNRLIASDGTYYEHIKIPAYRIPEYTAMGNKVDNSDNRNMLTQGTLNLSRVKVNEVWRTISAGIMTWNNEWEYINDDGRRNSPTILKDKIWRKHKTYVWNGETEGNGIYINYQGNDDNFDWTVGLDSQVNTKWRNISTINRYNHYSQPIETIDVNGNEMSTKMGDNNTKVFAVGNAAYDELFYSGAEDLISGNQFSGQVKKGDRATLTTNRHTGVYALNVPAKYPSFIINPKKGKKYKASVWMQKNGETYKSLRLVVDGYRIEYNPSEVVFAGNWIQLNFYTDKIMSDQEVILMNLSHNGIYDDFRFLPVESTMTSYVYNQWDELTYILGANNLATEYTYDEMGRLKQTYAEMIDQPGISGGLKLATENDYNHARNVND
ncbi:hypothetical protein [Aquimarina rhabdastrellae]